MPAGFQGQQDNFNAPGAEIAGGAAGKKQVLLGSGSMVLAAIEAVCVFLVGANGLILILGGVSMGLAHAVLIFHSAAIRLPILGLATLGALLNLWLLFNAWNLRRAASAQWRRRALLPRERRRIVIVAALSIGTLLLVASELYFHHKEHGSAFASLPGPHSVPAPATRTAIHRAI